MPDNADDAQRNLYNVRDPHERGITRTFDLFAWLIGGVCPTVVIIIGEAYCQLTTHPPLVPAKNAAVSVIVAAPLLVIVPMLRYFGGGAKEEITAKRCMNIAALVSLLLFHLLVAETGGSIRSQLALEYLYIPTVAMMVFREKKVLCVTVIVICVSFFCNLSQNPLFISRLRPEHAPYDITQRHLYSVEYAVIFMIQLLTVLFLNWDIKTRPDTPPPVIGQ